VDLKADRQAGRLVVRNLASEGEAPRGTVEKLDQTLADTANWLELRAVSPA
jgi:uncharacterized protein YcaQ